MKSAFSATLVGLFCSVTASLLNLRLEKAQSRYFEKLERFTIEELLPRTAPSVEDETLLEKVSAQMERYFDELREVAEQNSQTIQDLSAAQKAFETTITSIERMSRNGSVGSVQEVIAHLTGVIGELAGVNRSIVTLTDRLPETLEASRRTNQGVEQRVQSLLDSHRQWQTRIDNSLAGVVKPMPGAVQPLQQSNRAGTSRTEAAGPTHKSASALAGIRPLDEPVSQRTFLIYGAAALFILLAVLAWLR